MNHGVARQRKQALDRRVAREDVDAAAERALTEGYTCQEKYDLGACNVTVEEKPRKTMFPPGTIETFTGDVYNFQDPDYESIHLEDIAHALSNHCRYAGHTRRFYSVGEHSVIVSRILEKQGYNKAMQTLGLFHDAHEAYVMDAPRPLKPLLGDAFKEVANKADVAVAKWLTSVTTYAVAPQYFNDRAVKLADNMALVAERKQLMTAGPDEWEPGYEDVPELPGELRSYVFGQLPSAVEKSFLKHAYDLGVEK